jgi:hypothetical protein
MKRKSLAGMFLISFAFLLLVSCSPCQAIELLHWTFDQVDGDGTVVPFTTPDATVRGNVGTLTSMDTTAPVPGRVGNALQFSAVGTGSPRDRVEILNPTPNPDPVVTDLNRVYTQFTFAAFVKPVGIAAEEADTTFIAGKIGTVNASNPNRRGWQIGLVGTDAPSLAHPDELVVSLFDGPTSAASTNEYYSGPQTAVVNDQWAHVAFTFSSTTEATSFFRMYVNGVKIVDETTTLSQMNGLNTVPFQVGNRGDSRADSWAGLIDDVRLYDHALTDAEIAALIPPLPPAQVGDFNQNGKVDAADYVVWRENVGSASALPNDSGTALPVGTDHYNLWRSHYGNGAGSGAGELTGSAVPEPGSMLFVAVASALLVSGLGRTGRNQSFR